jgi:hypothetical protein
VRFLTKALVGAVTLATSAAGLGLAAPPASATACTPVLTLRDVPDVVITATGRAVVAVSVHGTDPCTDPAGFGALFDVRVTAVNPGRDQVSSFLSLTRGTNADGDWTGTLAFTQRNNVGRWFVNVSGTDAQGTVTDVREDRFLLRRNVLLSRSVAPRVTRRGGGVHVTGQLRRLTLGLRYVPFRRQTILVGFRRPGARLFRVVGLVPTNRAGRYARTFTARRTGQWVVAYAGSASYTLRATFLVRVRVR